MNGFIIYQNFILIEIFKQNLLFKNFGTYFLAAAGLLKYQQINPAKCLLPCLIKWLKHG
jgi:hypothetical protein